MVVWTSGEGDLEVGDTSTGAVAVTRYEVSNGAELAGCLDALTQRLTDRTPPA
ncbi:MULTISPECIES: hypothetical protein [Catenuloplanes]|uniref:Uncharacterized protein n=1 Tax=Catenuloplanes niger TaxID=587534 RepID=A0AAE3ZPE3_9ACTN|nr:hypothetical protein [Catenuloplanes niger]MDR7321480.1 hypothetical protein [Catenuloplanes niger]